MYNQNNGGPVNYYPQGAPYPNGYPYNGGYVYPPPHTQSRNTQPLTQEQINILQQNTGSLDMRLDEKDIWRAVCTHKYKNGNHSLVPIGNDDGVDRYRCNICGAVFDFMDVNTKEVSDTVKRLYNMLQTSKTIYGDISEELAAQYFQIIPLLEKFPQLWEKATTNLISYDQNSHMPNIPIGQGYVNNLANLQSMLTGMYAPPPSYAGFNGYQQPYGQPMPNMNMGMQQPTFYQNPQAVDPSGNPMAYGVPAAPVAPVPMGQAAPVPGVMPQAPAPAQAVAPIPPQAEVQQQQVFNV